MLFRSKHRQEYNTLVAELVVSSPKCGNGIVVDVQTEAVESKEDAYPDSIQGAIDACMRDELSRSSAR